MGDLKTELKEKVLPVIPQWTENGPDHPGEEQGTVTRAGEGAGFAEPKQEPSITEQVYMAVKEMPGKGSGFYAIALKGKVTASSVSSLLRQLEQRGYLRHTGERPMLYYPTDRPYEVGMTSERRRIALKKAIITRTQNARKRRDVSKRMTEPVAVPRKKNGDSPGVAMDPRDTVQAAPKEVPQSFPPTAMPPVSLTPQLPDLPQTSTRMTPAQFVEAMDVRTARAVLNELKQLFGEA